MPYLRLPDKSYIEVAPGLTHEQALDLAQRKFPELYGIEKTVGGYAKESLKGLVPGAIGLGETAVAGLASLLPEEQEKAVRGTVGKWAEEAKKPFRAAPGYDDIFGRTIMEGLGSTLPFFALGPAGIAGRVGAGVLAGAAGAGEARQEAEQAKATPEQKSTATALGVLPGLLDIVAPEVGHLVSKVIPRALLQGGVEGATEAAQKIAQNAIAKGLYNPEQPLLKDAAAEGGVGAVVGTLASLLMAPFMKQKGGAGANIKPPATEEEVLAHRKALEDEEKRLVEERRQAQYAARVEKEFQRRLPGAKEAYDEQVRKAQAGIAPGTQLSLDQTIQPFDEERVRAEAKEAVDRKIAKKLGLPYVSPSQKAAAEEPEDEARARYEYEQLSSLKQQVMGTMQDASDNGDEAGYQKAQATYAQLVDPKGRLAKLEKQFGSDELPLLSVEAAQKKLAALEEKIEATKGRFESIDKLLEQRARAQKQLQQAHSAQTAAAAQAQQGAAPAEAEQVDLFKDLEQRTAARNQELLANSQVQPEMLPERVKRGVTPPIDLAAQQDELTENIRRRKAQEQTQEQLEEMRRQSAQMQLPLERGQGAVPPIPAGVAIANRLNQRQGEVAAVEERLAEAQKALETAQPWQKEPLSRQVSLLQEELAHRKQQLANTQRQNALFEKFHEGKRGVKPFNPLAQVAPAAPVGTSRPNAAHVAVTEQAQRVENALFEFGETIDRLRSDVDSGRPVQLDQEKARGLINEIVDATFQHAAAQRQLNGLPPVDQAKLNTAELMMRSRLEGMLSIAPMRRVLEQQRPGAAAEEASLASARAEVAKSYGFTPEQLLEAEKQNPDLRKEVGQRMVPALARAKAQREKQGEIRHGMKRSGKESELADVQDFVQRIRKALQGKKEAPAAPEAKKRARVPGPGARIAEMYERAREMAHERQRTEQRRDTLAKQTLRTARLAKVAEGRLKQLKKRLYERGVLDKEGSSYRGGLRALRSERFKYLRQIDELTTAMFHSITSSMVERAHKNMLAAIKPFLRNGAVRSAYDKFLEAQKSVAEWQPKVLKSADYLGFINSEEVFDALGRSKGHRNPQGAAWKRQHEAALSAALTRTGRPARFSANPQSEHDLEVLKATEVLAAIEANKKELTEQHAALKKALDDASAQLRMAVRAVKGEGESAVSKDVSDQIDVIGKDYEALLDSPKIDLPLSEELLLEFVSRQQEQALDAFENLEATNKLLGERKALATAKAEAERLTEQIDAFTFTIESLANPEQSAPRTVESKYELPPPKPVETQPTAQSVAAAADANVPTSRRVEHQLAQVLPHQVSTRALTERKAKIAKLRAEVAELGRKVGLNAEEYEDTAAEPRPGRGKAEVSNTRVKDNETRLKKIEKLRIEEEGLANAEEALAQHPELTETADAIERVRARIYKIAPQLGLNPENALDPDNAPIPEYTRTKRQQQLERRRLFLAQNLVELQGQMTVPLRRTRRFVAPQTESTQEEAMEAWDRQREEVQERVARGLEKQRKELVVKVHTLEYEVNEAQAFSDEYKARKRATAELTAKRDELKAQLEEAHDKAPVKAKLASVQAQLQAQRKLGKKQNVSAKKAALTRAVQRLESIEARAEKLGVKLVPRQDSLKAALAQRDVELTRKAVAADRRGEKRSLAKDLKTGIPNAAKGPKGARTNIGTKATEARLKKEVPLTQAEKDAVAAKAKIAAGEEARKQAAARGNPSPPQPKVEPWMVERQKEIAAGKPRLMQRPAAPVAAAEAQSVVDRVKAKLPAHITFNFYPTLEEARAAHPEMAGAEAGGAVLPDGTVVVVGDMHADVAGLEETIAHELVGHYGVDAILGKDGMGDINGELWARGGGHVAEVAFGLGSFPSLGDAQLAVAAAQTEQQRLVFTSEMIARSAEPLRVHPTFVQQVTGFVKGWLRRLKQLFSNWNLSSQAKKDIKEIQKLVQEAHATFGETRQGVHRTSTGQIQFRTNTAPPPAGVNRITWDVAQGLVYKKPGKWASIKANLWGIQGVTQFVDNHAATIKAMTMGRDMGLITEQELSQALYWLRMYNKNANLTRLVAARGPLHIIKVDNGRSFMVEPKGGADAPTLEKAFKALAESGWSEAQLRTGATMYLAAKRVLNSGGRITPDMLHFGKNPDGSPVLTEALLRDFVAGVDSDPKAKAAFDKFRNIYNEYNKGLVSFLAESGFLSKEEAAALAKTNDYVPYYRPTPTGELQLFISGEKSPIMLGNLKDHKDLKHLVGGDTPILDLFTSALQNTHMMTTMAMRNIAARNTAYMMKHLGLSANRSRSGAIRHVAPHSGKQLSGPNTIHFRHNYTDDNGQEKHTDAALEISTKGTAFEGIPTELIITGLEGIKTTYPKLLEALGAPSKFLRRMVILNPIYPLRQLVKDSVSSWGISGANYKPIIDPARNMLQAAFGKQSATMSTMEARGLVGGQLLSASNEEQMATVLRELSTNSKSPTAFLAKVEAKYMQVDAATREAAYNSFRAQGLSELDTWIATNELMDFNKRGTSSAVFVLNNLIPFFNAQIQGLNVFARAATGRMPSNKQLKVSTKFYARGLSLAALTVMYAALMRDDDAYKNATPEQRLRNWFIPTPFTDEPVKVPIPFEYGLAFKAIPEALFTTFTDKDADGKAILKGLGSVAGQSVPGGIPPVPQFAKPAIEAFTGIDLYTLRPIESAQERKMEPFMRVRDNTSGVAEALGKAMNVSPVMVDHLLQTIGGPLAASMATASSLFSDRPPSASYKTSQMPVVGTLFQATDAGGIINEVYDTALKALESQATYKQMAETGDERAEEYSKQHENMLAIAQSAGAFKQKMGELTKYERSIRTDRGMSPKDKREQLDEVRRLKIDTAKAYREVFRQASGT